MGLFTKKGVSKGSPAFSDADGHSRSTPNSRSSKLTEDEVAKAKSKQSHGNINDEQVRSAFANLFSGHIEETYVESPRKAAQKRTDYYPKSENQPRASLEQKQYEDDHRDLSSLKSHRSIRSPKAGKEWRHGLLPRSGSLSRRKSLSRSGSLSRLVRSSSTKQNPSPSSAPDKGDEQVKSGKLDTQSGSTPLSSSNLATASPTARNSKPGAASKTPLFESSPVSIQVDKPDSNESAVMGQPLLLRCGTVVEDELPVRSQGSCFLLDAAEDDDDIFMVEEATHKDFSMAAVKSHAVVGGTQEKASQNKKAGLTEAAPKPKRRPPPLAHEPSLPLASPLSVNSSVFGRDGGFTTGGFRITSEGMVNRPPLALREDSEIQTLSGPESMFGTIQVRSLKEFRKGPTIGHGAAGRVYLALHEPSAYTMAIKVVNVYDSEKRNQLMKELETLSIHVSRYLVRFFGAFYDGSGAVHIALEYMDRGCLSSFIKKFGKVPEAVVRMIAVDCLRALRFLHKHHVLHRDFKTANILLSRRQCCAKMSDFGLARDLNAGVSKADTFVGTVAYMSPERLQGSKYTYASDIWALGVSLVECLLGKYPFERPQSYFDYIDATMTENILGADNSSSMGLSAEVGDFLELCTNVDPLKRPTAIQLLEHAWLKNFKRDKKLFGAWMDDCASVSVTMSAKSPNSLCS